MALIMIIIVIIMILSMIIHRPGFVCLRHIKTVRRESAIRNHILSIFSKGNCRSIRACKLQIDRSCLRDLCFSGRNNIIGSVITFRNDSNKRIVLIKGLGSIHSIFYARNNLNI